MRYTVEPDLKDDVVTVYDEEEELKTEFDSEIMLAPVDDALIVVRKLNEYEAIVKELYEALLSHEDKQDIDYWMKSAVEELDND